MIWLILGLALWCVVHFIPTLVRPLRTSIIASIGEGPYKGLFALTVVVALVVIVMGWRAAIPTAVYDPPVLGRTVTTIGVLVAFWLFVAARLKSNVKRFIRHPQLTGLVVWSVAHLAANGDRRSVVLFGVLGIWAVIEMLLISRREGAWARPAPSPVRHDLMVLAIGTVAYVVLVFAHPFLFGVSVR